MNTTDLSELEQQVQLAAQSVALGDGDELVVLPSGTKLPGAQHDDGVTAISAIDLIRNLVAAYEDAGEREDFALRRAEQYYSEL